jgi:hypothetical protein
MKTIILAALLGSMTFDDVNAMRLQQLGPKTSSAEAAAAVAEKAGVVDEEKVNKQQIQKEKPAEMAESMKAENDAAALQKQIEARIAAESQIKLAKGEEAKKTEEEK